ncbi:hypothetical protein OAO55_00050 [Bacteroidales bacterium]|nr:hypothetical protein [Bacteroidales bacterium]
MSCFLSVAEGSRRKLNGPEGSRKEIDKQPDTRYNLNPEKCSSMLEVLNRKNNEA